MLKPNYLAMILVVADANTMLNHATELDITLIVAEAWNKQC